MKQLHFLKKLKIPFAIFLVCLVAYLPLSSFLFALKNDALVYNLPPKHFFSEALQHRHLPIWNPYLNFGYPIYADPGFAWWQPITWLFGIIGYNAYTLNIELLFYIYIAGLGMYWLCRKLDLQKHTALAIGCMFMCSGFFIGNLQHINFLTCAAFLPWVTAFWILYQKDDSKKHLLGFCISTYFLCTGGHPAIPVATALFFLIITLISFFFIQDKKSYKPFFITQLKLLFCVTVVLLPLIISYYCIFPFYVRSESVDQAANLNTGFTIQSYISFLFPFATIKNYDWFATDVSMRNAYFSIPGFIFFILFLVKNKKTNLQNTFLIAGFVMLLMSAGGALKELIYQNLPGFSYIKTNGEYRIFAIFSLLICSSHGIEKFLNKDKIVIRQFNKIALLLLIIAIAICILIIIIYRNELLSVISINSGININTAKLIIDNISFVQSIFISLLLFIFLTTLYLFSIKSDEYVKIFISVLLLDIVISSWMLLPITGVGTASVAEVQNIIKKAPKGFPLPMQIGTKKQINLNVRERELIKDWAWYNKRVELHEVDYPSRLKSNFNFFNSSDTNILSEKSFAFFKNQNGNALHHIYFSPASSIFKLNIQNKDTIIILQNYLKGWEAKKNHHSSPVIKLLTTFIAIPVDKGDTTLSIKFTPL